MSYISSSLRNLPGKVLIAVGIMMLVGLFFQTQYVGAVSNNKSSIPNDILETLRNRYQDVDSANVNYWGRNNKPGPWCDSANTKYHFQIGWLSPQGAPMQNRSVTASGGEDSVDLQYNRTAGTCHRAFTKDTPAAQARIKDASDLRITHTNIVGVTARTAGNQALTASLPQGMLDDMSYQQAYAANQRFIKPPARAFTLSGIKRLAPGTYTVFVAVEYKMVNRFGDNLYTCVNGGLNISNDSSSDRTSGRRCPVSITTLKITLSVLPEYAGECAVTAINGTSLADRPRVNIAPNQAFTATFRVKNAGTRSWNLNETDPVRLGTVDDATKWGSLTPHPSRVNVQGVESGGSVLGSGTTTTFTRSFRAASDLPAVPQEFAWRLQKRSSPAIFSLGTCSYPINSASNQPFLRVSGSDIKAGAIFTNSDESDDAEDTQVYNGLNAPISTNGLAGTLGSSSGQYGVFASGLVDASGSGVDNMFGNNLYVRESRKDLLFANTGLAGNNYGKFYTSGGLPDIDITTLMTLAKQRTNPDADSTGSRGDNNDFKIYVSNVNDNNSAYFDAQAGGYSITGSGFSNVQGSKVIIVKGDITIGQDLVYGPGSPNMILIALGNIYIRDSVKQLDGTYIAFPTSETNGIVDTCSNVGGAGEWPASGAALNVNVCNQRLTVNGRLIAKNVLWKRTFGTINNAGSVLRADCAAGTNFSPKRLEDCAAEFVNFTPEVYFNSPFGSKETNSVGTVPTSTVELPPIY